ncbi:hypothetical protein E5D57_001961 [Metarhizium anisopliae]|nr:hypothetical protein E5D57_001961 [Metarhizium anisopliae]
MDGAPAFKCIMLAPPDVMPSIHPLDQRSQPPMHRLPSPPLKATQGHSRPLQDLQTAQVPRLDTLQRHAPVTPLLLDPHLAFIVSPRPGV